MNAVAACGHPQLREGYLAICHRFKLDELLVGPLPAGRESVAWSHVAALLTVARFCAQHSALSVAEHW